MSESDYLANSIGLVVDRVSREKQVLACSWLVDNDKVATTGDSVKLYGNHSAALEVVFPALGTCYGVSRIFFHPQFKRHINRLTSERSEDQEEQFSVIRKHDCAILYLSETLEELTEQKRQEIEKAVRIGTGSFHQGLSGDLGEIDFSVLVQTLTNARKQGELIVVDRRNHPIAQVFCDQGRILFARYGHLENELAIHQIVEQRLKNSFYFRTAREPSWSTYQTIGKSTDSLLLESYTRLDQLENLRQAVGGPNVTFIRKKGEWGLERLPAEVKEQARALWKIADGLTPASRLWQLLHLDDSQIFNVLSLLLAEDLIAPSDDAWLGKKVSIQTASQPTLVSNQSGKKPKTLLPLPISARLSLNPYDLLAGVIVDSDSGRIGIKHGQLLGAIDAFDSQHLIHNLPILPESGGCPIFNNGYVVAMHVGVLPSYPEISLNVLEQCLWVDSILNCLSNAGETNAVKRLSQTDIKPVATLASPKTGNLLMKKLSATNQSGCVEVATIGCPRCGASSFSSARFCENCSYSLIPSKKSQLLRGNAWRLAPIAAGITLLISVLIAMFALPQANLASGHFVYVPRQPALTLAVNRANLTKGVWEVQSCDKAFKNSDTIHLSIEPTKPCYVYLLLQTNKGQPKLIYPVSDDMDKLHAPDKPTTFPEDIGGYSGNKWNIRGMTFADSAGRETIVALASPKPLELPLPQDFINHTFAIASDVYGWGDYPQGFEVEQSELAPGLNRISKSQTKDDSLIFVTRLIATHN